jgi:hypothetical protein
MPNNIAETIPIGYEIISYFNPTLVVTILPAFCHMCGFAHYLHFSRVFRMCDSVNQWAVPLIRFCVNWIVNRCRAESLMCEIDRAKMHCAIRHCAVMLMCGIALCGTARCFWCRKKFRGVSGARFSPL